MPPHKFWFERREKAGMPCSNPIQTNWPETEYFFFDDIFCAAY